MFSACLISSLDFHTIEIHGHPKITILIKGAFKGARCHPHVAFLPTATPNVLRCFPNVRDVTCSGGAERVHAFCRVNVFNTILVGLAKARLNVKRIQLTNARSPALTK